MRVSDSSILSKSTVHILHILDLDGLVQYRRAIGRSRGTTSAYLALRLCILPRALLDSLALASVICCSAITVAVTVAVAVAVAVTVAGVGARCSLLRRALLRRSLLRRSLLRRSLLRRSLLRRSLLCCSLLSRPLLSCQYLSGTRCTSRACCSNPTVLCSLQFLKKAWQGATLDKRGGSEQSGAKEESICLSQRRHYDKLIL